MEMRPGSCGETNGTTEEVVVKGRSHAVVLTAKPQVAPSTAGVRAGNVFDLTRIPCLHIDREKGLAVMLSLFSRRAIRFLLDSKVAENSV